MSTIPDTRDNDDSNDSTGAKSPLDAEVEARRKDFRDKKREFRRKQVRQFEFLTGRVEELQTQLDDLHRAKRSRGALLPWKDVATAMRTNAAESLKQRDALQRQIDEHTRVIAHMKSQGIDRESTELHSSIRLGVPDGIPTRINQGSSSSDLDADVSEAVV